MRLIRQHNIINGLLLIAAVSVSSCNSILEDDSLPVSNKNIETLIPQHFDLTLFISS